MAAAAKLPVGSASLKGDAGIPRTAGIIAFARQRKADSRQRLLTAAEARLCEEGYLTISIEDIAAAAEVSRVTFYRHFSGKAALVTELYRRAAADAMPRFLLIRDQDFRDRQIVHAWIDTLFAADRANRRLLRVFTQAIVVEPSFTARAQELTAEIMVGLGRVIPVFAADPERPAERRRWLEAWLLLYEILNQSNHAALDSGIGGDPLVVDILTDRFLAFIGPQAKA